MRYIYFSPHLDDAVLSAGGLIYEQTRAGIPVEIWTFMSGFPNEAELTDFARVMHKIWGTTSAEQTVRTRRREDQKAAGMLGAKAVHFDFLDCIYRRGKNGETLYSDASAPLHAAEADLPAQLAQTMVAWLKPDDVAVCQLTIGGHVDHVIVRRAAEMLSRQLVFDADIPYLLNHPGDLAPKTAGMKPAVQSVSEAGFGAWLEAAEAYSSQLSSLFESREVMREKMRGYWAECRGIRFWKFE
jgi:LmbE family N-acetylglucosaminyl deacetylase